MARHLLTECSINFLPLSIFYLFIYFTRILFVTVNQNYISCRIGNWLYTRSLLAAAILSLSINISLGMNPKKELNEMELHILLYSENKKKLIFCFSFIKKKQTFSFGLFTSSSLVGPVIRLYNSEGILYTYNSKVLKNRLLIKREDERVKSFLSSAGSPCRELMYGREYFVAHRERNDRTNLKK